MTDDRTELMLLLQQLVTEGTTIVDMFAALHGLHPTDLQALSLVLTAQQQGTPLTAGALASQLGLTSGAITFALDRLERAGHLTRKRDDSDRRRVSLLSSPSGRAVAESFLGTAHERTDTVMDAFTPAELEVVRSFLSATGAAMAAFRTSLTDQVQQASRAKSSTNPPA